MIHPIGDSICPVTSATKNIMIQSITVPNVMKLALNSRFHNSFAGTSFWETVREQSGNPIRTNQWIKGKMDLFRSGCITVLLLAIAFPLFGMDNNACFECHDDKSIHAEDPKKAVGILYKSRQKYAAGKHLDLPCIECHQPLNEQGFATTPHQLKPEGPKGCIDCHGAFFLNQQKGFAKSVHFGSQKQAFNCSSCHDPHYVTYYESSQKQLAIPERIRQSNSLCLTCHNNNSSAIEPAVAVNINQSHASLVHADRHLKSVRCVDCHALPGDMTNHYIGRKDETVACISCHSSRTPLLKKLYGKKEAISNNFYLLNKGLFKDDVLVAKAKKLQVATRKATEEDPQDSSGLINRDLLDHVFVIGAVRNTFMDGLLMLLIGIALTGVILHGIARILFSPKVKRQEDKIQKEYLYSLGLRIWHWVNAALMIGLMVTGFLMHFSGNIPFHINFKLCNQLHRQAAIGLSVFYLIFIINGYFDGNHKSYLPVFRNIFSRFYHQLHYYTWGIFRGDNHPFHATKGRKFNPIQKTSYLVLMVLLFPVLILSGSLLFFPEFIPEVVFGFKGYWLIAACHTIVAVLFVVFLVVHLYLLTTGDRPTFLIQGMINGYHSSYQEKSRLDVKSVKYDQCPGSKR